MEHRWFVDAPAVRRRFDATWPALGAALRRAARRGVITGLDAISVAWDELSVMPPRVAISFAAVILSAAVAALLVLGVV